MSKPCATSLIVLSLAGGCSLTTPATQSEPQRTATAAVAVAARDDAAQQPVVMNRPSVQFAGASLWGELPGAAGNSPTDATENLRQISYSREGSDFDVAVDPTGRFIAFASTQHRTTADIYIKRVDGSTVTQITTDAGNDVMPAFSPDGQSIAYCSDRAGNFDIYLKNIEGGQAVQVTNDPAQEFHPSFSPDGKQLVFSSLSTQSGQWEIVVVDVANPAKRKFIGFGLFPSFSPDGAKIVFQRARFRGTKTFSIWTVDYINGEGVRPTEIAAAANAAIINPCWSSDGKRLAFAAVVNPSEEGSSRPEQADLWAVNIDGTNRMKLTNDKFANLQPCWSRDGAIYFISNRNGSDNIWALRPTDSANIAHQPRPEGHPTAEVPTTP